MREGAALVEDLLRHPLQLVWYRVADAPIRYRALELGDVRFAWTVPPFMRPRSGSMLPQNYALTLTLSPFGDWRVREMKPFEWPEQAERWARGLWHDAVSAMRRRDAEWGSGGHSEGRD